MKTIYTVANSGISTLPNDTKKQIPISVYKQTDQQETTSVGTVDITLDGRLALLIEEFPLKKRFEKLFTQGLEALITTLIQRFM
jgi:hypothetical protein